jgi:hypothetical protein
MNGVLEWNIEEEHLRFGDMIPDAVWRLMLR